MVRVVVDGRPVEVREGAPLLEAIRKAGAWVPTLCLFGNMYREASCRLCLVELGNGKLVPACAYPASEGLEVRTESARVFRVRRAVLEFVLAFHRMRCWECPRKGGHCILLELSKRYWVEGIPVCSSCPLHGEDCLVVRGVPCLGPITLAGCNRPCPADGSPCIGCRGPVTRADLLREAATFYVRNGVTIDEVIDKASLLWGALNEFKHVESILKKAARGVRHG